MCITEVVSTQGATCLGYISIYGEVQAAAA